MQCQAGGTQKPLIQDRRKPGPPKFREGPRAGSRAEHANARLAVPLQIEVRPMMYVALTYDHRLIDGREAVTFLRKIKAAVEDPRVLLLDL